jgi:hypothetical protein
MRNNRTAGHNYERTIRNEIESRTGIKTITTRLASRDLDNKKVDIIFDVKDKTVRSNNYDALIGFQCKTTTTNIKYEDIFDDFDRLNTDGYPEHLAIITKKTKKVNTKFINQGEFVTVKKELFYDLIKHYLTDRELKLERDMKSLKVRKDDSIN